MRTPTFAATLATALIAGCAFAQAPKTEEDHSAHHPPSTAASTVTAPGAAQSAEAFNQQMKAMQDMHQKMQAARTPAERAKLMDEQFKLMQSSMAMMGQMRGGPAGMPGMPGMGGMPGMPGMGGSASGGMGMMPPGTPGGANPPPAGNRADRGGMMNMHAQMERRMAMMEHMMQMMVDREAAKSGN